MEKIISHIDLDSFFVSVERLKNSDLIGKPVIVGGDPSKRGVVASASYEARKFGVHSAMATSQALRLCPNLIIVGGSHSEYSRISKLIYNRLCDFAPIVEKASIDEMYMDLTGCEKIYKNNWINFLSLIQEMILKEFNLPCTISIASSKTIAKIATNRAKPNGKIIIQNGNEKIFLAPLDISIIPGVGEKTEKRLKSFGIHKIEDIQNSTSEIMKSLLGEYGELIFEIANGNGSTEVANYSERKSISSEETFEVDIIDKNKLEEKLFTLVEKVASILRKKKLFTETVKLKIRFSDFSTTTRMKGIERTHDDKIIYKNIISLFEKNFNQTQAVRLLGAGVTNLSNESEEYISLFEDNKREKVLNAVDEIKNKFGDDLIHTGSM